MGYNKVTGVISKETDTGDADRYLTILTLESGKVQCYAKGIRNQKSKLAASAGLFCYGEYQLYEKCGRYTLTSGKLIENFYDIRSDVMRLSYAIHFLEVAGDIVLEGQPFTEAIKMLMNSLYMLSHTQKSPELISRIYELRMLSISGFSPVLDKCAQCGREIGEAYSELDGGGLYFSITGFGLVCGSVECKGYEKKLYAISKGSLAAMRYIINCGSKEVFNFSAGDAVLREISEIIPMYLKYNMDREYTKLDYINSLTAPYITVYTHDRI
jgi:DNA repair protein RecO (recombination protein O)